MWRDTYERWCDLRRVVCRVRGKVGSWGHVGALELPGTEGTGGCQHGLYAPTLFSQSCPVDKLTFLRHVV